MAERSETRPLPAALPSARAASGRLFIHLRNDKPRRLPWRVDVVEKRRQICVASVACPAEGEVLAVVADRLRRLHPDLPRKSFREIARRVASDRFCGQAQLPLGDPWEAPVDSVG